MLKDKELRKTIGSRAKSRRQELGLNQPYVAVKNGRDSLNHSEIRSRND